MPLLFVPLLILSFAAFFYFACRVFIETSKLQVIYMFFHLTIYKPVIKMNYFNIFR